MVPLKNAFLRFTHKCIEQKLSIKSRVSRGWAESFLNAFSVFFNEFVHVESIVDDLTVN